MLWGGKTGTPCASATKHPGRLCSAEVFLSPRHQGIKKQEQKQNTRNQFITNYHSRVTTLAGNAILSMIQLGWNIRTPSIPRYTAAAPDAVTAQDKAVPVVHPRGKVESNLGHVAQYGGPVATSSWPTARVLPRAPVGT